MIFKKYGQNVESVETNFDSKALTEISFRRDRQDSIPTDDFFEKYEQVEVHELEAKSEGSVQDEAEQVLLDDLEAQLREILDGLGDDEVLYVESQQGEDYPKTRQQQKNVIVEGQNKLYFYCRVEPPLRVGVYRRK